MKILLSLLMAIMFLGGQAVAEEGDICDGQVGAAFGLCNAYCNAMECNSPEPHAAEIACTRVSTLFEQITGSSPHAISQSHARSGPRQNYRKCINAHVAKRSKTML